MNSDRNPSANGPDDISTFPDPVQIKEQLQRILSDPEFRATKAQRAFLTYVVEKVLSGKSDDIKGYSIATEVFGRQEDFDQATDPIVSIHANKLRRALEHYYLVKGMQSPIRIDIPKGTYVPTFQNQTGPTQPPEIPSASKKALDENSWPVVLVMPFENHSDDSGLDLLPVGLQTELVQEITRYMDIRVLMYPGTHAGRRSTDSGARFILNGNIRKDPSGIKITVNLTDARTSIRLWGDVYQTDYDAVQLFSFQEEVSRTIVSRIAGECGIIAKTISAESKKYPPTESSTYQALLLHYDFQQNYTVDTFTNAFEALNLAAAREPDCGRVWSMLARMHAINTTLELFDAPTSLQKAMEYAQQGVRLEPANLQTRLIMGFVFFLTDAIEAALQEVQKAAELNPNAVFYLENVGYLKTLCGDWENGPAIIRKAIQLNPFYSATVHHALWVHHIWKKNYRKALLETYNFRLPTLFWDPLLRAATLGLTNSIEEGKKSANHLLALKPDIAASGRRMIAYYAKFEEVVDATIEGLRRVGIAVE